MEKLYRYRVDSNLHDSVQELCKEAGISTADLVRLSFRKFAMTRRLDITILAPDSLAVDREKRGRVWEKLGPAPRLAEGV